MRRKPPVTRSTPSTWSASQPARDRELLLYALAVSLYVHGMLMLLRFGAPGLGLPGLAWPWMQERVQAPPLEVRVAPPPLPAAPSVKLRLSQELSKPPAAPPLAARPPRTDATFEVQIARVTPAPPPRVAAAPPPAPKPRVRKRKPKAKPQPTILAQTDPQEETFKVPPPEPAEVEARRAREREAKRAEAERIAKQAAEDAARRQAEEAARVAEAERLAAEEAARLAAEAAARIAAEEAARVAAEEAARLAAEEALRRETEEAARRRALAEQQALDAKREAARKEEEAQRLALELEARRLAEEDARREAEEIERRALALAKAEEEKKAQEKERLLALETEALRIAEEAAREAERRQKELEAQRQKEIEAQRLAEAAAREKEAAERARAQAEAAAQRERDGLAARKAPGTGPGTPGAPTAPGLTGRELAAKALEQLRTPGAREELLRPPSPPPRADKGRRRSVFGVERDVSIRMYVEGWRNKIERNGALNYRPSAGLAARDNPVVTVSIRRDGTLENVVIHRSSGLRELDDAVRNILELNAPYAAFPPDLARQYDVIEIRRVWFFDRTLKIMDEL